MPHRMQYASVVFCSVRRLPLGSAWREPSPALCTSRFRGIRIPGELIGGGVGMFIIFRSSGPPRNNHRTEPYWRGVVCNALLPPAGARHRQHQPSPNAHGATFFWPHRLAGPVVPVSSHWPCPPCPHLAPLWSFTSSPPRFCQIALYACVTGSSARGPPRLRCRAQRCCSRRRAHDIHFAGAYNVQGASPAAGRLRLRSMRDLELAPWRQMSTSSLSEQGRPIC